MGISWSLAPQRWENSRPTEPFPAMRCSDAALLATNAGRSGSAFRHLRTAEILVDACVNAAAAHQFATHHREDHDPGKDQADPGQEDEAGERGA
jgi:hypothetical protein